MRNYHAKDVDAYIAGSGSTAQPALKELRKVILSAVPYAEEGISWGVPFYKYHGLLAGFAAFKNHVSFGFAEELQGKDRTILEENGYKTGKKTIQIRFDQKVPASTITHILTTKAKINEAKKRDTR